MFSTASMIHGIGSPRHGDSDVKSVKNHSRPTSPVRNRRHRRSYTISAPLGTRVNAFPSPVPSSPHPGSRPPTPPPKNSPTPGTKENAPPRRCISSNSAPLLSKAQSQEILSSPASPKRPRIFHTTSIFNDRFLDLPPLPEAWTIQHDRAICLLDARDYSHAAIVARLRRAFPELRGTLTPLMVDKRLRILDQNVELDYWRVKMNHRTFFAPPRPENRERAFLEEASPAKARKGSRFLDVLFGRNQQASGESEGLGLGLRSVFEKF